jgi:hypothetical protein
MKVLKMLLPLTAFAISIVFSNTVIAAESVTTESKDSTKLIDSPVDTEDNTAEVAGEQQESSQLQTIDDTQSYYRKQFEERRRQIQEAQLEAYKQFLERRNQYSAFGNAEVDNEFPAYIQERRDQFLLEMEERRAYNVKMMEEYLKAAEERRNTMQLKMQQTNSACEDTNKV